MVVAVQKIEMTDFENTSIDVIKCTAALGPIRDALYVLNGKWKLPIIIAMVQGSKRFGEIKKSIDKIAAKVLSNELKELEINGFLIRKVYDSYPVRIEYELTDYSSTLGPVLVALNNWGVMHREKIMMQVNGQKA